ncbi:hypothetical protein BST61_g210 [Cercospora zeina]
MANNNGHVFPRVKLPAWTYSQARQGSMRHKADLPCLKATASNHKEVLVCSCGHISCGWPGDIFAHLASVFKHQSAGISDIGYEKVDVVIDAKASESTVFCSSARSLLQSDKLHRSEYRELALDLKNR